jgi:DNA-binding transcriptional MerR regulator
MTLWTLAELRSAAETALEVDYPGAVNGRVRALPDARTIRYYRTLGLMDRPAQMRGRTAFYSRRHLLQIVAIKRLQAEGLSLAEIQRRFAGMSPEELERIAQVPPQLEPPAFAEAVPTRARRGQAEFWKARPRRAVKTSEPARRDAGPLRANSKIHLELAPAVELVFEGQRKPTVAEQEKLSRAAQQLITTLQQCGFATAEEEEPS